MVASTSILVRKATGGTMVYRATLQDGQHIVRLLCWWEGGGERLLVYEYVGNGTLREQLRRGECSSWRARMEVLLGAACAVENFHCHAIKIGRAHV